MAKINSQGRNKPSPNCRRSGGERWWEIDKGFETLNEAVEYAKQCQSNGYVIIDIQIRDFEVSK